MFPNPRGVGLDTLNLQKTYPIIACFVKKKKKNRWKVKADHSHSVLINKL